MPSIFVHIVRHGDKQGDALTPKGKWQAAVAGWEMRKIIGKNDLVKLYHSPAKRTRETVEWIARGLQLLPGFGKGVFYATRQRKGIALPKSSAPRAETEEWFKKMGGQDKYVEAWLNKTLERKGEEPPEEVAARLRKSTIKVGKYFSRRLKATKPVHLVYATHQGGLDKLVSELTGRGVMQLGGLSQPAERVTIEIPSRGLLKVSYRGRNYEAPRE